MSKHRQSESDDSKSKYHKLEKRLHDRIPSTCPDFRGIQLHILPTGMGTIRYNLFREKALSLGAVLESKVKSKTYVVVDESVTLEKVCKILNWKKPPDDVKIVKSLWLSKCIEHKSFHSTEEYELWQSNGHDSAAHKNSRLESFSSESLCNANTGSKTALSNSKFLPEKGTFVCSMPSRSKEVNYNKRVTDKLELLLETYKSTGDQWRTYGYEKAIIALKNHPKPITSWDEAKSLNGVGDRLADKIMEIIQSGNLRKVEEVCFKKQNSAISLFTKVWGIGPNTAQAFVQKGFYTLDDLKYKAKLTNGQQIGLKYFEELQERMPRSEAAEIFNQVVANLKTQFPSVHAVACGSYRRNQETCGDLDILITDLNGPLPENILPNIIHFLHHTGLLTDDLVSEEENGAQKKYMGVCKLSGADKKHRRIDIIAVPHDEYACALMHFTGSAHFNRSIRLLAAKNNMSLSEYNLRAGVIRKGREKYTDGYILTTPTEESIFSHLGLEYRPPHERDH